AQPLEKRIGRNPGAGNALHGGKLVPDQTREHVAAVRSLQLPAIDEQGRNTRNPQVLSEAYVRLDELIVLTARGGLEVTGWVQPEPSQQRWIGAGRQAVVNLVRLPMQLPESTRCCMPVGMQGQVCCHPRLGMVL